MSVREKSCIAHVSVQTHTGAHRKQIDVHMLGYHADVIAEAL